MTLRVRLLALTLSMIALVAVTLISLNLDSLVYISLEFAIGSADFAGQQVHSIILRRLTESPAKPGTIEETKRFWRKELVDDDNIAALLEQTMAQSRSIVEINVAGDDGKIVASSNPGQVEQTIRTRQDLRALRDFNPLKRMFTVLTAHQDYEISAVPLGIAGQQKPVFSIQILVSSVLLQEAMKSQLKTMAEYSSIAMIVAFLLAYWSANLALRPLAHISHLIDDITTGNQPISIQSRPDLARELVLIESKLSLLGERYRDAREDASQLRTNLESVLEKLDAGTRRHIESQIALAQRLTAINALTARVAHEIKNPLNSISLRIEMLRSKIAEESPDAEAEFAILSEEVMRLDRVVRTFLDFNRPVQLNMDDLNIAELAAEILESLGPEAMQKGIEVTFEQPEEEVVVKADADLLRQALVNIAVNAIEAMERGGQLRIYVEKNADSAVICVQDTGPGIPPAQRDKIFQLYYTTKPRGSGIGLAMTFRAVQLHGGTIEVEGEPGKGTTFRVTLPLAGVTTIA